VTYKELLKSLEKLTEEQLDQTVTVKMFSNQYFSVENIQANEEEDVLDSFHPFLVTSFFE